MSRLRACAAVLRDKRVLMVYHQEAGRSYWTLPGGGVEPWQTPDEAAIREVREENGLDVRIVRPLFEEPYGDSTGVCICFLAEIVTDALPVLGHDPEEAHLKASERLLQGVAWHVLDILRQDGQVAQVLKALGETPHVSFPPGYASTS